MYMGAFLASNILPPIPTIQTYLPVFQLPLPIYPLNNAQTFPTILLFFSIQYGPLDIQEMQQAKGVEVNKFNELYEGLSASQLNLKIALRQYQNLHSQLSVRSKIGYDNNQNILAIFVRIVSFSFKPIEYLLRFLEDTDILNTAATCQTLYRSIYSPLGYRIIRSLRPVVVKIKRQGDIPKFNQGYLQNLCNDISLVNLDEDDKVAIIQTMKTNLMAARQKMKQIEQCNLEWERRKKKVKQQMVLVGQQRQAENKCIEAIQEQTEKIMQLLKESSSNIERLKCEQEKMLLERETKKNDLEVERTKLTRQKELLIKKIKSQQKQREEGLVYAREVTRVTAMLNKLTAKK